MSDSFHVCTSDGSCFCGEDAPTNLSDDDALDTIRGGVRERKERVQAELADVRRQLRGLPGRFTREQAAELVRISERRAPNYQRLAPVAEEGEDEFEHFLPIRKRQDPLGKKLLSMSDEPEVAAVLEVEAPKKRQKLLEVWHA
jgi:hypothetical protein